MGYKRGSTPVNTFEVDLDLTGVTLAANQTVAVYGRSRSGYYIFAPQLTIVQTA